MIFFLTAVHAILATISKQARTLSQAVLSSLLPMIKNKEFEGTAVTIRVAFQRKVLDFRIILL